MNFLKKLATPFVAIGRWIKETAWVQPLLIVGAIFAVIFSIPSITSAITNAINQNSDDILWYKNNQLSLEGSATKDSKANDFFNDYVEAQGAWEQHDKAKAREIINKYSDNQGKFFLFFVQNDCTACSETKEASEYLMDHWDELINDNTKETKFSPFEYQSIICDQTIDNDKDELYKKIKPFEYLYGDQSYQKFGEDCNAIGINNHYYYNSSSSEQSTIKSNLEALISSDSSFQTPLIVLIDTTDTNKNDTSIISTLFYKCNGGDKYEKAEFLANCWKGEDIFSPDYKK